MNFFLPSKAAPMGPHTVHPGTLHLQDYNTSALDLQHGYTARCPPGIVYVNLSYTLMFINPRIRHVRARK